MESLIASKIIEQIIEKGGLMGRAARNYVNDKSKEDQFIRECFVQCHHNAARHLWGEKLISEIERYVKGDECSPK
jgi:hypothetical protein